MAITGKTITDVADDLAGKTSDTARRVGTKASEVMVDVKDEVAVLAGKAGTGAKSAATSGKDYAAEAAHSIADAARQIAGKLDDGQSGGNAKAADFARKAADSIDSFSTKLRDKDIEEIADDARNAVRHNPAIAVGAAALIGFALARFLKGGNSGGHRG